MGKSCSYILPPHPGPSNWSFSARASGAMERNGRLGEEQSKCHQTPLTVSPLERRKGVYDSFTYFRAAGTQSTPVLISPETETRAPDFGGERGGETMDSNSALRGSPASTLQLQAPLAQQAFLCIFP